nr:DUF3265 domain-containing protein [Vibrio sp. HI00D65]
MTKRSELTHNAWLFCCALSLVITAVCSRLGVALLTP